jgi:hypothetical protein
MKSEFMARKEIRIKLHDKRCEDKNQTIHRMIEDAKQLDIEMALQGYHIDKATNWSIGYQLNQ